MSNHEGAPVNSENSITNSQLEPLDVTGVTTVTIGTVLWGIATVVLFLKHEVLSADSQDWPWIALAGFVLGLMGIRYTKRRVIRMAKNRT